MKVADPSATEEKNEALRKRYQDIMFPIFFPEEPTKPDIKLLFSSLLRVLGMEDKGWDPFGESSRLLKKSLRLADEA